MKKLFCAVLSFLLWTETSHARFERAPCSAHQAEFGRLIGRPAEEARRTLLEMAGIIEVRQAEDGTVMTTEFLKHRATIIIRNGNVARISCG